MPTASNQYHGPTALDKEACTRRSHLYDFVTELQPGIWKVYHKKDKTPLLALDATDQLFDQEGRPTDLMWMLDFGEHNMIVRLMSLLNHENIVNLVDWVAAFPSNTPKIATNNIRQYFIWDFCNAGTLENLFLPQKPVEVDEEEQEEQTRLEREATAQGKECKASEEREVFLPESFCWHVLVSILKALAWLHHGVRDHLEPDIERSLAYEAGVDWHTILHRNIAAGNIFFCHPLYEETYGLCKLGNFGKAFVSGHANGIMGDRVPRSTGKVLAGRDGHVAQDILRQLNSTMENCHPPAHEQPYSILSEYRAVGDIILAMMVQPKVCGEAHVHEVRSRPFPEVVAALGYSDALKSQVYTLMSTTDDGDYSSFNLYEAARDDLKKFMAFHPAGTTLVLRETLQCSSAQNLCDAEFLNLTTNGMANAILKERERVQEANMSELTDDQRNVLREIAKKVEKLREEHVI